MHRDKKSFIRVTASQSSEMQKRYQRLHSKYLTSADKLLSEGDLSQASEKYWGAVAGIVKNIAAKRKIRLKTHQDIRDFMRVLDEERPDLNLWSEFGVAQYLHSNFYEDEIVDWELRKYSESVKALIQKLSEFL
jgi:hypothetical protein